MWKHKQNINIIMAEILNTAYCPRLKTCVWRLGLPPSANKTGEGRTYSDGPITKS
jgi:hypothetical protein